MTRHKDRSEETEDQALISAIKFVHEDYNYSLVKPVPCFSFESLAVQDYNNIASDDKLATVSCLDIEA